MKRLLVLLCVSFVTGCSFAPKYHRPPTETPPNYKESGDWLQANPHYAALNRGDWWRMYNDPQLDTLEGNVVCANQNLQAALARYEEARAVLAQQRSAYFPNILGVSNGFKNQASSNIANPLNTLSFGDLLLAMTVTYEVDLWGRVRNSVATARKLAQASAADVAAIDLSLHAELASDYFALHGDDAAQQVLDKIVVVYEKSLYLTHKLYEGGAATIDDMELAQNQLYTAKTLAADLHLKRAQLEHAIAVLIDQPPATFSLPPAIPKTEVVTVIPELPSVLLERRPDIAEAELKVQAANYNIGVARAAFFPAFNLSAGIGYESDQLSNLLNSKSLIWTLGPSPTFALQNSNIQPLATQPIFEGGKLVALSHQAYAQYLEAAANYRETVLNAYKEVEDSLVALHQLDQENKTQTIATAAINQAVQHAMDRYQGGLTTYLQVVVEQNLALQAELSSIDIRTRRQLASVQLIKALGGGYGLHPLNLPLIEMPAN